MTWTVADGGRGRRWRSVTSTEDGRMLLALLLETGPGGDLQRLEAAAPGSLLTLHPEPDASALHGNLVRPDGIEHLDLSWSTDHVLLVAGSPLAAAIAAGRLRDTVGVGEGRSVAAVEVRDDCSVRRATLRVARPGPERWILLAADGGPVTRVELDAAGLPVGLEDARTWPMELAARA